MRAPVSSGSSSTSVALSVAALTIASLAVVVGASSGCATGITDGTTGGEDAGGNEHLLGEVDGSNAVLDSGNGSTGDDDQAFDGSPSGDDDASPGMAAGDDSGIIATIDSGTGMPDSGGGTSSCATELAAASFDFESGVEGWSHGVSDGAASAAPSWPLDPWTQGTATDAPACPSGSCFGAELTQNYAQCQRGYLLSPKINLAACTAQTINLTFKHLYSFWTNGTYADGGIVEVSPDNGSNWHTLTAPTGVYSGTVSISPSMGSYSCVLNSSGDFHVDQKQGWIGTQATPTTVTIPIPAALVTSQMLIRFSQASGVSSETNSADSSRAGTSTGWRVDNVAFVSGT